MTPTNEEIKSSFSAAIKTLTQKGSSTKFVRKAKSSTGQLIAEFEFMYSPGWVLVLVTAADGTAKILAKDPVGNKKVVATGANANLAACNYVNP